MGTIRHSSIQKKYETPKVDGVNTKDPVASVAEDLTYQVPQWQIDMVMESVAYYKEHPEELLSWDDAWKIIDAD